MWTLFIQSAPLCVVGFWWMLMNHISPYVTEALRAVMLMLSVCGSCTLTVLVGCGLSSVLSVYPQFLFFSPLTPVISLTVASLQGVAQDFMLSRFHCLTLSLSSVLCLAEVSCSLHSSAASTTSSCLSVVVLHRCRFSFFGVILCVHLLFVDLLSFWLSDTPSPLPAVRSPMVQCCACFQFCGWSVGLSPVHVKLCQLVLCRGLSPEWTMCIKLSSFLVWLIHNVNCHIEVMLWREDFCVGSFSWSSWWNSEWGDGTDSGGDKNTLWQKDRLYVCIYKTLKFRSQTCWGFF